METLQKSPNKAGCDKKSRFKTAGNVKKCGLKYKDWRSKEFRLFDSLNETVVMTLDQEQANVSCLMKEHKGTKCARERSTGKNIFDAERHELSKKWNGIMKRSVIKETYANVTVRQK